MVTATAAPGPGLSIVQAILESYGSALTLTQAGIGGLDAGFFVGTRRPE